MYRTPIEVSGGACSTTMRIARYVEPHTTYTTHRAVRTSPSAGVDAALPVRAGDMTVLSDDS